MHAAIEACRHLVETHDKGGDAVDPDVDAAIADVRRLVTPTINLVECDCCQRMVPFEQIGHVIAAGGTETSACCACRGEPDPRHVNIYLEDRFYGGPEEGGWWYEHGIVISSAEMPDLDAAIQVCTALRIWCDAKNATRRSDISSVLSEGRYYVVIEDSPAENYPKTRPHYE